MQVLPFLFAMYFKLGMLLKVLFQFSIFQTIRERDAVIESITDLNATIIKFREVVQKLSDENLLLRKNLEEESSKSIPGLAEALDFKVLS